MDQGLDTTQRLASRICNEVTGTLARPLRVAVISDRVTGILARALRAGLAKTEVGLHALRGIWRG